MNSISKVEFVAHLAMTCLDRSPGLDGEIGTSCRPAVTFTRPTAVSASSIGPDHPNGF
jgi:hypothetical protein